MPSQLTMRDLYSDDPDHTLASYMRVAALAIAAYDWLRTLPTVLLIYKEQRVAGRITLSGAFIFLIQLSSIAVLTFSNVGFFYSRFSLATCQWYYMLPPTMKVVQAMISQAILGTRAYNLSRRSRPVGYALAFLYACTIVLEIIPTICRRASLVHPIYGNCLPVPGHKPILGGAYTYYVVCLAYDVVATVFCVYFLLKYKKSNKQNSLMRSISDMMLFDGIGYFLALSIINVLNIIFYSTIKNPELQTAAAAPAYTFIWIMTQRLLLHLHDASSKRRRLIAYHQGNAVRDLPPTIAESKISNHDHIQPRSERAAANRPESHSSAHSLSDDFMEQLPRRLPADVIQVPIHQTRTLDNTTTTRGDYYSSSDDQSKSWHAGLSYSTGSLSFSPEKPPPVP